MYVIIYDIITVLPCQQEYYLSKVFMYGHEELKASVNTGRRMEVKSAPEKQINK